jgi:uncharacterized protein DUF4340
MKTSYLTNLVLVCIIAALFWFSQQTTTPDITINSFEHIDVHTINDIQVKREHRDTIKLLKHNSNWKVVQPIEAAASNLRAILLLSILDSPSHNQLVHPSDETLIQLGLKPIKLSLQLNEHVFIFGDNEPLNKRRYVLYKDTVYLMDDKISPLLNATAASFINNRLIANNHEITSIQLPLLDDNQLSTTQSIIIDRNNDHWQSLPQINSTGSLTNLIKHWQQAEAMQVIPIIAEDIANSEDIIMTIGIKERNKLTTLGIQLTERNLFLIDNNKKLKYQFPAAMAQQLFFNHKDLN